MAEHGFTPGPWEASYDDRNGEHVIRMGQAIATPWSFPSEQIVRYDHSLYPGDEDDAEQWAIAAANARLIAASPTLLEALIQAAEEIEELRRFANNNGAMIDDERCDYARAAITLATGKDA